MAYATKIGWREAVRRFRVLRCIGCAAEDDGREWWLDQFNDGPYCAACVEKKVTAVDEARSVTQFYTDTKGEGVRWNNGSET